MASTRRYQSFIKFFTGKRSGISTVLSVAALVAATFFISCKAAKVQPEQSQKPLYVALLGDSMTWIGGENFEKPRGWTHYFVDLPVEMKLYARSGATWTNTESTTADTSFYSEVLDPQNVVYNQALRLINDSASFHPNLIIMYAGANDAWFSDQRPGLFDDNTGFGDPVGPDTPPSEFTTLEGSVYLSYTLLKNAFPESEFLIITPVEAGIIPTEKINAVGDALEQTAQKLGISYIRGDREIPFHHEEEIEGRLKNTYDGGHSNESGAQLIANRIKQHIFSQETIR